MNGLKKCWVLLRENEKTTIAEFDVKDKGDFYLVVFEWGILADGREFIKKAKRFSKEIFQQNPSSEAVPLTLNVPINMDTLAFEEQEVVLDIIALDPEAFDPTANGSDGNPV